MESWNDFAVALAGASAALAGLIFVAVSINLERLLRIPAMRFRAATTIAMLTGVLVLSSFILIPGQSIRALGLETLGAGAASWIVVTALGVRSVRLVDADAAYRTNYVVSVLTHQCATAPAVIGGIILTRSDDAGMYWLAAAFIASFVVALAEAWVILVEIAR